MFHMDQKKWYLNHKRNILAYMRWVSMASGYHRDKLYPLWCFLIYIWNSTSVILFPIYVSFEVWMETLRRLLLLSFPTPTPPLQKLQLGGGCSSYKHASQLLQVSCYLQFIFKWRVMKLFQEKEPAFLSKTRVTSHFLKSLTPWQCCWNVLGRVVFLDRVFCSGKCLSILTSTHAKECPT